MGVGREWLRTEIYAGRMKYLKRGRRVMIRHLDILAYFAKYERGGLAR